jgi:hypothetical protein
MAATAAIPAVLDQSAAVAMAANGSTHHTSTSCAGRGQLFQVAAYSNYASLPRPKADRLCDDDRDRWPQPKPAAQVGNDG